WPHNPAVQRLTADFYLLKYIAEVRSDTEEQVRNLLRTLDLRTIADGVFSDEIVDLSLNVWPAHQASEQLIRYIVRFLLTWGREEGADRRGDASVRKAYFYVSQRGG